MKGLSFSLLLSFILMGCASNPNKESIAFVDEAQPACVKVAYLSSTGISLIPPVASMFAKSMLEEKASQYRANSIVITKKTGIFQVDMEADAYRCSKEEEKPEKKKGKKFKT